MLRRAWRRLRATPVFTIFAVFSLALGIGVTTAIYSTIAFVAGRGLDLPNAHGIALMHGFDPNRSRPVWRTLVSKGDFDDLRSTARTIGELAASAAFHQSLADTTVSELVPGEAVTGNYFQIFGLTPFRGRLLQPADDELASQIAVVSERVWRTTFASDPDIVGRTIRLGGQPFEIVGVAPEAFGGLSEQIQRSTSVWIPLAASRSLPGLGARPADPGGRNRRQLAVLATPAPGTALQAMSAEVAGIGARLDDAFPMEVRSAPDGPVQRFPRGWFVRPADEVGREADSAMRRAVTITMAIVGLVLVVACTNLANLVLARGSTRLHELAVRRALGASRARLVLEELAESGLLAVMGALGAYLVMRVLLVWFTSANLPISQAVVVELAPHIDWMTLVLAAVALLASLVVFGVGPALQLTRAQVRRALASEGGATGGYRWKTRRGLIALQVAISVAFFLIAAFAVRSVVAERSRPSGIDLDRLATGMLSFHLPPWNATRARETVDRLVALAGVDPAVESIAVTSGMPFGNTFAAFAGLTPIEKPFRAGRADDGVEALLLTATPSIFRTIGVPIERGRPFDARDTIASEQVAVLSELAARQIFGTANVVGRQLLLRNVINMSDASTVKSLTVVGVAADTDTQFRYSRKLGVVYLPLAQHYEPALMLVGRTAGDPREILGALRSLVRRADPDLVFDRPGSATEILAGAYVLVGIVSRVAGGLAILAMVLAMAGLFGVLSHLVARRTRELGVRMALGAAPASIRRLVISEGMAPVLAGIVVGLMLGGLGRTAFRSIYGTLFSPGDVLIFALAPVPIVIAGLAACYWPARRASKVDPNVALREL